MPDQPLARVNWLGQTCVILVAFATAPKKTCFSAIKGGPGLRPDRVLHDSDGLMKGSRSDHLLITGELISMYTRGWPICRRFIAMSLAVSMVIVSGPLTLAHATMISTDQIIEESSTAEDRARVMEFLTREEVRQELQALGVNPDEAMQRATTLSDREIRQIAGQLEKLPAGQSAVGAVVGAIVLIFLVLLITDLLGLTDVYPFVKKQR